MAEWKWSYDWGWLEGIPETVKCRTSNPPNEERRWHITELHFSTRTLSIGSYPNIGPFRTRRECRDAVIEITDQFLVDCRAMVNKMKRIAYVRVASHP